MGEYKGIKFSEPRNTDGLLPARPKGGYQKAGLPENSLARKMQGGVMGLMMEARSAGHQSIFAQAIQAPVIEGAAADLQLRELEASRKTEKKAIRNNGGEASMRLPNRASFAGSPGSFRRGDQVIHTASRRRGVVLGPSRSKPGKLKISVDGETYRVSPVNLERM